LLFLILFQFVFCSFASFSQSSGAWLRQFGGPNFDMASKITTDLIGNIYFSGFISDTVDFDPGPGVYSLIDTSYWGAYLCKLDPSGELIWIKQFSSTRHSTCHHLQIDKNDNVYISGQFSGTIDLDPGSGTYTLVTNLINTMYSSDYYICKLNSSGDLIWGRSFEVQGFNNYSVNSLSIDTSGNVYACGEFYGIVDLDPGPAVYTVQSMGAVPPWSRSDCFICKLDPSGNFVWAKIFGGTDYDHAAAMKIDLKGNICLIGSFRGVVDFDSGPGTYNLESPYGLSSFFVMKLNDQGNLIFAEPIYGDFNWNCAFALDSDDNFYCTGYFTGEVDFDPGAKIYKLRSSSVDNSAFILKLDAIGNFKWARSHSTGKVWQLSAAVDKHNNLLVTGANSGGFVEVYSTNGYLICEANSSCYFTSVHAGQGDNIYLSGGFSNKQNLNLFGNEYAIISEGNSDFFVTKQPACRFLEENVSGLNNLLIYPNPSNGIFTAYSPHNIGKKCLVEVYNALGEKVFRKYTELCNSSEEFNLGTYPKGIYLVKIDYSNTVFAEKIILQ
jgi:hypothetical protein